MIDDRFEAVAITHSQPETAVLLSLFAHHGIPVQAVGFEHLKTQPDWGVALGGVRVRVWAGAIEEARDLLRELGERPAAIRPAVFGPRLLNAVIVLLACLFLGAPVPPTRTPSTYLLERRAQ